MLFRFTPPELARLDELDSEVLAAGVYADVRPARGLAGLCDWRLGGRISRLMREGFVTGRAGEVVMLPGKPHLTFHKILLFGLGPRGGFGVDQFLAYVRDLGAKLTRLRARAAVVELPGRREGIVQAGRAIDALLDESEAWPDLDQWTLVEDADGRAALEEQLSERRRRVRRSL